jgi:preprotein translocase subunit SecA
VVSIPTNRPLRRRALGTRVFRTSAAKWAAVVERIRELHEIGRPVLVGTRTVRDSERLAGLLAAAGLECRVLNALQDRLEAEIIAQAGQPGQITVATNMAGRGTDIKLGLGIEAIGGLHVLATERHDAQRIDRQLFGRCGRQGQPGTYEAFISLEDELLRTHAAALAGWLAARRLDPGAGIGRSLGALLFRYTQRTTERRHFVIRRDLLKLDESMDRALAFSGHGE